MDHLPRFWRVEGVLLRASTMSNGYDATEAMLSGIEKDARRSNAGDEARYGGERGE